VTTAAISSMHEQRCVAMKSQSSKPPAAPL
jgi:hypothetical protein